MDQKRKHKHGFTLGKFMPPHTGHGLLIDEAARHVDRLTILVCSVAREPIPGKVRYEWMMKLYPHHNVIHVTDEVPSYPDQHPDFWTIWKMLFKKYLPVETAVFFSGEAYGDDVARHLGIGHIMVDRMKDMDGASATAIRAPAPKYPGQLAFSPDGRRLATAGQGEPVQILDARSGALVRYRLPNAR